LQRLCQDVVPVAGLLAQAAVTLREAEYRTFRRLAELPHEEMDELLLSVDRFTMRPATIDPAERGALLRRFALYGVRVGLDAVRVGKGARAAGLADALLEASGVGALRALLAEQFAARRDLLKGRAALLALSALAERYPVPGSEQVEADIERILTSTHAFAEIRMLDAIRVGDVPLSENDTAEVFRLLGGHGASSAARLGVAPDADSTLIAAAAAEVLDRWQRRAENPLTRHEIVEVARTVVRTCEGITASQTEAPVL
jgi:hypothetical protein